MSKYAKGAFPKSVLETNSNTLFVRKSVSVGNGKQKQIWRKCEPQTAERATEVLREIELQIEAESLTGKAKKDIEIAKVFLKVQAKEISFSEFKKTVKFITK